MDEIIKKAKSMTRPRFAKKDDNKDRQYYTAYSNVDGHCCISLRGRNLIVPGNPKISIRIGQSRFGDEIIFELLRTGAPTAAPQKTKIDTIEIYMPMANGLKFLEDAVAFFKKSLHDHQ